MKNSWFGKLIHSRISHLYTVINLAIQEELGSRCSLAENESRSRVNIYWELAILTLQKHIYHHGPSSVLQHGFDQIFKEESVKAAIVTITHDFIAKSTHSNWEMDQNFSGESVYLVRKPLPLYLASFLQLWISHLILKY